MIDWIASKVAMSLAALILLAGVVAYFLAQQEQMRHDALRGIADQAAAFLEEVSQSPGEFATTMSLGPGGRLELPGLALDRTYRLTLYGAYVVAGADGDRAFAVLGTSVHLWQPPAGDHTSAEVDRWDVLHPSLVIESGGTVVLSRRSLSVDGSPYLWTFAFP